MFTELERESHATGTSGLPVYSNSTPKSFNSMFFVQPAFFFSVRTNPSAAAAEVSATSHDLAGDEAGELFLRV
jgi:hypothetical protein